MAWLEQHPTSGHFKICFRWGGKKFKKAVKTTSLNGAEIALARFKENLNLLERGRMELPRPVPTSAPFCCRTAS
jgi:hypothetical protein